MIDETLCVASLESRVDSADTAMTDETSGIGDTYDAYAAAIAVYDATCDNLRYALREGNDADYFAYAAREDYNAALDKAYAASGKAFELTGNDAYSAARDAFATAYAELNDARSAYKAALDAALTASRAATITAAIEATLLELGMRKDNDD